jgi:hypothetical protein
MRRPIVWLTLAATAVIVAVAVSTASPSPLTNDTLANAAETFDAKATPVTVTIHRSATCDCCGGHRDYLVAAGFSVTEEIHDAAEMSGIKENLAIPRDLWSCHTTIVDGYAIEGHVPVDVIKALLVERLNVDGVALPAMPAGSPGMTGSKNETWTFHAFRDGKTAHVFATL